MHRRPVPRRLLVVALALLVAGVTGMPAAGQTSPIQYGYDELGRLVIVVNPTGDTAVYNYDLVGNLLSIERIDASQLPGAVAITHFTPQRAKVGASVSIFGKGFSATPSENTVSFNGGSATVVSATTGRLVVTVPSTALTGPISVTTPLGNATSAASFRVLGALTVTPATALINVGATQQFTVAGPGGYTQPVTWSVNGVAGGNATVGTASSAGLYTAPSYLPQSIAITVRAADQNNPTTIGTATATVVASGTKLLGMAKSVSVILPLPSVVVASVGTRMSAAIAPGNIPYAVTARVSTLLPSSLGTMVSQPISATFEPFITDVSPTTIARGANNLTVTLSGWGFESASGVAALLGQTADSDVTISISNVSGDGTQATLMVTVASGAAVGVRVMQLTTPSGTSTDAHNGVNTLTVQ